MDMGRELTRQAYMDGELSVEEVIAFEASCSDAERREIAAEQAFERVFVERVSQDSCPDALWMDVRSRITRESRGRGWRLWPMLAAALLALGGAIWMQAQPKDLHDCCIGEHVPGDFAKVRSSLTQKGFHINLSEPDPDGHHPIKLQGLSYYKVNGELVAELKFSCCHKDVKVYVSSLSPERMASLLQPKDSEGRVYSIHERIDSYEVHAFGQHLPDDVLNLFS